MKLIDKMLIICFVINTIGLGIGIDFKLTGLTVVFIIFFFANSFVGMYRYVSLNMKSE